MDLWKLQKTLGERLESLALAGLTHLPLARSRIEIAFEASSSADSTAKAPVVHESPGRMQTSTLDPAPPSLTGLPPGANSPTTPKRSVEKPPPTIALADKVDLRPYGPSLDHEERLVLLNSMSQVVAGCTRCNVLSACRKKTVFGVGNIRPRLVFFGEAPGADEDRVGEPFVGAAGQLLDKIIAACKMKREDVYIMNTVKCRPPDNRNPTPSEMANCWEFAERQLEILRPEFICCLGRVAAQMLLKTESPIGHMRGKFFQYRDSQVVVTYHPAYLLRTESAKKLTWDDMRMLMGAMGISV